MFLINSKDKREAVHGLEYKLRYLVKDVETIDCLVVAFYDTNPFAIEKINDRARAAC